MLARPESVLGLLEPEYHREMAQRLTYLEVLQVLPEPVQERNQGSGLEPELVRVLQVLPEPVRLLAQDLA